MAIVADLDVLVEGFDKLEPSEHAVELRRRLLEEVDAIIDAENRLPEPNQRLLSVTNLVSAVLPWVSSTWSSVEYSMANKNLKRTRTSRAA